MTEKAKDKTDKRLGKLRIEYTENHEASGSPWPRVLKAIRAKHGLTQKLAAKKIRVCMGNWIGWENGQKTPSRPAQELLVRVFGAEAKP